MKDYSIPSEVLHNDYFQKHPERIAWLVKLLDISDDNGVINLSRHQIANVLATTPESARYFMSVIYPFSPSFHQDNTKNGMCKSECYDAVTPSKHQKNTKDNHKRVSSSTKEPSLVTKVRGVFEEYVKEHYQEAYYWTPKDAAACKRLIKEIEFSRSHRENPLPIDDDGVIEGFKGYINAINDQWLLEHFTMAQLASSFQQIKQQLSLQNGKSGRNTAKQSLINSQKQSIATRVTEIERRWRQSQSSRTEQGQSD